MAIVDVLKQLLARQVAAVFHDLRQPPVVDADGVPLAALAAKLEPQRRAAHGDMIVLQRRQPERPVRLDVFLVADADAAALEQLHDGGEDLLAGQAWFRQICGGARPYPGQRGSELQHAVVLRLVARRTPIGVIPVLLAAARVASCRLQVPARIGADPDVRPRGRDRQLRNPLQLRGAPDSPALTVILEAETAHPASDAGTIVGDIAKTRGAGRLNRVQRHRRASSDVERSLGPDRSSGPSPVTAISLLTRPDVPTMAAASSSARDRSARVSTVPVRCRVVTSRCTSTSPTLACCNASRTISSISSEGAHASRSAAPITGAARRHSPTSGPPVVTRAKGLPRLGRRVAPLPRS